MSEWLGLLCNIEGEEFLLEGCMYRSTGRRRGFSGATAIGLVALCRILIDRETIEKVLR